MFAQLYSGVPQRKATVLSLSLIAHLLLLAWFVHSPAPIFVAPTAVSKGDYGSSLTRIYFGGTTGVTQDHPSPRVIFRKPAKNQRGHSLEPPPAKMEPGNAVTAPVQAEARSAGSPYGSLSYGTLMGAEVRPALPVFSPDPALEPDMARAAAGDVVLEITIDEQGNVVDNQAHSKPWIADRSESPGGGREMAFPARHARWRSDTL